MKTLTLPLKRKWFDLIKDGTKKEEYRSINSYWIKRLLKCTERDLDAVWCRHMALSNPTEILNNFLERNEWLKHFDQLVFTLGYPKADDTERRLVFKNPKVRIGQGNHMWGAIAGVNYFCITWEE